MYPKVIRDGKVAVVYSPSFIGGGWYTENRAFPECLFDPDIVEAVESDNIDRAHSIAAEKFGEHFYACGGDLKIRWIPVGQRFIVCEYDGSEFIITEESLNLVA